MPRTVVLNDSDNVATCLEAVAAGETVLLTIDGESVALESRDAIAFGHKIALRAIATGSDVLKYGQVIGRASVDITPGQWVHVHNIESVRARGDLQ